MGVHGYVRENSGFLGGQMTPAKRLHTAYCERYRDCDKDTDCYSGEYCPWFIHSEDFSSLYNEPYDDRGEFSMEQFWKDQP